MPYQNEEEMVETELGWVSVGSGMCFNCGGFGHLKANCPSPLKINGTKGGGKAGDGKGGKGKGGYGKGGGFGGYDSGKGGKGFGKSGGKG